MRTGRALTVFRSLLLPGGGGGWGGVSAPGEGGSARGGPAWSGGVCSGGYLPGPGGVTCLVGGVPGQVPPL